MSVGVNYSALKDGASSFRGNCLGPRISPRLRTDIPSTSRSGLTGRQYPQTFVADIPRRIDVPVMMGATMAAIPRSDIKRHLVADRTTLGTRFGTRIPTVALNERLAGARSLVFKEASEHAPSRIGSRRPRETVVLHDTLHLQIFDGDHLVFVYDPPRQFVQVVPSGARHTLMRAGHQLPGFAGRSILSSCARVCAVSVSGSAQPCEDGGDYRTSIHRW